MSICHELKLNSSSLQMCFLQKQLTRLKKKKISILLSCCQHIYGQKYCDICMVIQFCPEVPTEIHRFFTERCVDWRECEILLPWTTNKNTYFFPHVYFEAHCKSWFFFPSAAVSGVWSALLENIFRCNPSLDIPVIIETWLMRSSLNLSVSSLLCCIFLKPPFFFFFFLNQFLCEKSRTELRTKSGRQNRRSVLLKDDCNRPETESESRRGDLTESTLNRILC